MLIKESANEIARILELNGKYVIKSVSPVYDNELMCFDHMCSIKTYPGGVMQIITDDSENPNKFKNIDDAVKFIKSLKTSTLGLQFKQFKNYDIRYSVSRASSKDKVFGVISKNLWMEIDCIKNVVDLRSRTGIGTKICKRSINLSDPNFSKVMEEWLEKYGSAQS